MIYYISQYHILPSFNYNFVMAETKRLSPSILNGDQKAMKQLEILLLDIQDIRFLKQVLINFLLKLTASTPSFSTVSLAECLIDIEQETNLTCLQKAIIPKLQSFQNYHSQVTTVSCMTKQIFSYVEQHIKDPKLTLKYISEQYLFMNTDYVSKKFQKETGIRFSTYLTNVRIQKAKEYLAEKRSDKIQTIAEMVGCGNNPQYFSQLFKKNTGLSPSAYLATLQQQKTFSS